MKNLLCLIFLLLSEYYGAQATSRVIQNKGLPILSGLNSKTIGELMYNNTYNDNIFKRSYPYDDSQKSHYKFDFDDGNPDIHGNIKRPCQVYDTSCIRIFFAEHSKCKISGRRLPDPFFRSQATVNYASANMTAVSSNYIYEGMNRARVEEFYINTVTDNMVIALFFDAVTFIADNINLKFYLRGREPEVHRGPGTIVFEQITVTMVIPGLHDLRLDRAEITTYANNQLVPFVVSPTLALTTNPEVLAMTTYFLTVGLLMEQLEQLSTEGSFFSVNYLQYNICDFGFKAL